MKTTDEYKKLSYLLGGAIIILVVILLVATSKIVDLLPIRNGLKGYFYAITEEQKPVTYRANFDWHTDTYYIESVWEDEILSQGKYEKYNDNLYILYDNETNEAILIVLLHDKFYYKHPETNEIIEFMTDGRGQLTYFE